MTIFLSFNGAKCVMKVNMSDTVILFFLIYGRRAIDSVSLSVSVNPQWVTKEYSYLIKLQHFIFGDTTGHAKVSHIHWCSRLGVLKTKTPKTQKLENKDPQYFSGLRNYDQPVANATESWALTTRILRLLLAPWTDNSRTRFCFKSKNFVFCFKQGTYPLSLWSF